MGRVLILLNNRPNLLADMKKGTKLNRAPRRYVAVRMPAAVAWLALDARREGGVVSSHSTLRRARREAAERAGVRWEADILRHTCASMLMGAGRSASDVAAGLGNSPQILLTHYRELVRREDAERFWAIRPKAVESRKPQEETTTP